MSFIFEQTIVQEVSADLDDDIILGDEYGEIIDLMMDIEELAPNFPITKEERSVNVDEMSVMSENIDILNGADCWTLTDRNDMKGGGCYGL